MSIMKIFINRLNLSQKSPILVECKAFCAMQYYSANAILIGQAEPMSIFPKLPSPKFITFIALSNYLAKPANVDNILLSFRTQLQRAKFNL